MGNAALSAIFRQMADVMEILGEDRFRINSYRTVARVIEETGADIAALLESGDLANTPGIGKSSLAKIEEFVKTGRIQAHQELLAKIPPTLPDLLTIPGVGPKSVKTLYEHLHISSIPELKKAIEDGSIETLPGFGAKKAAAILRGIDFLQKASGRIRLDQALIAAQIVTEYLRPLPGIDRIETAGSLRRCANSMRSIRIGLGLEVPPAP